MADFKKYDSDSTHVSYSARLAKEPEVKEGPNGPMVRLTYVDTSRKEGDEDMWIEASPFDRDVELSKYLKKGDSLGIEGHLCMRKYGEGKVAFNLRNCKLHIPLSLFMVLKERGFTPGQTASAGQAPPLKAKTAKREILEMPE